MTLRRLLALPLALITACSADPPALPPSAGGEAGSQVTPSLDATTLRATMVPGTSAFIERKPCALLAPEELTELELEPPGTPEKSSTGWACKWNGKQFSMIITIEGSAEEILAKYREELEQLKGAVAKSIGAYQATDASSARDITNAGGQR